MGMSQKIREALLLTGKAAEATNHRGRRFVMAEPSGTGAPMPTAETASLAASGIDDGVRRVEGIDLVPYEPEELDELRNAGVYDDVPPVDLDDSGIVFGSDPNGMTRGISTVFDMDAADHGADAAVDILDQVKRRLVEAPVRDQSMPGGFPDARNPERLMTAPFEVTDLPDSLRSRRRGDANLLERRMRLDYEDPEIAGVRRHEKGHLATQPFALEAKEENLNHWINGLTSDGGPILEGDIKKALIDEGMDSSTASNAAYANQYTEMLPYLRDAKMQNYYGLEGGEAARMTRPISDNLAADMAEEGQHFDQLMAERRNPTGISDQGEHTLDMLLEEIAGIYHRVDPEQQKRLRLAWTLLTGAPLAVGLGAGNGSAGDQQQGVPQPDGS